MTNKAAFKARFAHYERKPGLKVMRLHFEVPLEKGMETISILGEPTPDNDVWVGIALLGGEREEEKKQTGRRWRDLNPAQQAGMRCQEPAFQRFMRETRVPEAHRDSDCASLIYQHFNIESRSELNKPEMATLWHACDREFQAWMAAG